MLCSGVSVACATTVAKLHSNLHARFAHILVVFVSCACALVRLGKTIQVTNERCSRRQRWLCLLFFLTRDCLLAVFSCADHRFACLFDGNEAELRSVSRDRSAVDSQELALRVRQVGSDHQSGGVLGRSRHSLTHVEERFVAGRISRTAHHIRIYHQQA